MISRLMFFMLLAALPAVADTETFHGWSKDGTWFVKESRGLNDVIELYFCASDSTTPPTWPASLNDIDRLEGQYSCVKLIDINKAPYQWKKSLVLPEPSMTSAGVTVSTELVTDGDSPGFLLEAKDKKQICYAQGLTDNSKLQKVWWHPNGKKVAAQIDGQVTPCTITLKAAPADKKPVKPVKGKK